jgi:hypothetical protein
VKQHARCIETSRNAGETGSLAEPGARQACRRFQRISLNLDLRDALLAQIRERVLTRCAMGQEVAFV